MLYGCIQPYNRFLSFQLSSAAQCRVCLKDIWTILQSVNATLKPKGCWMEQPKHVLVSSWWSWTSHGAAKRSFVTGNLVPLFAEVKTKLVLITARSETACKATLILIKPELFYSVTMRAGKQRWCSSQHCAPSAQQLQRSALEPCFSLQHLLLAESITLLQLF